MEKTFKELRAEIKGQRSEKKVEEALKRLKKDQDINIKNFIKSTSSEDRKGVDFHISCIGESEHYFMPLQVKYSKGGQENHKQKYPCIPSIVAGKISIDKIESRLKNIIYFYQFGKVSHL